MTGRFWLATDSLGHAVGVSAKEFHHSKQQEHQCLCIYRSAERFLCTKNPGLPRYCSVAAVLKIMGATDALVLQQRNNFTQRRRLLGQTAPGGRALLSNRSCLLRGIAQLKKRLLDHYSGPILVLA